jgi:phosphoserine phosphatase RsbU/P
LITRQRRFRFLEARRPEHDDAWARVARDYLHPKQWPVLPGWNVVGRGLAGKRSEHEFVDSILLPDGRLMLSIGVVRAQGIQAALAITSTRTVLRACGQRLSLPDDSLRQCGTSLCLQFENPVEVRCTVLHLDPRTGWLDFACAGTNPLEAQGDRILQIPTTVGDPMGLTPNADFVVGRVRMEKGNLLIVLGPSMAEARYSTGDVFLQAPLTHILDEERLGLEDLTERIFRGFKDFRARLPLFDPDLTVIALERLLPERRT